jgi:hypothetical protein
LLVASSYVYKRKTAPKIIKGVPKSELQPGARRDKTLAPRPKRSLFPFSNKIVQNFLCTGGHSNQVVVFLLVTGSYPNPVNLMPILLISPIVLYFWLKITSAQENSV